MSAQVLVDSPTSNKLSTVDYALQYARIGWHVFPLSPRSKTPHGALAPHGHKDATVDAAQIRRWWTNAPDAGIGVSLAVSGLLAIDIDPRNGGRETIDVLESQHGPLHSEVLALTGNNGEHRVFAVPAGDKPLLPGKLGAGIDVKHNGYIVVEPSIHPVTGREYVWEASSSPLDGVVPSKPPTWIFVRPLLEHLPASSGAGQMSPLNTLRRAIASLPPDGYDEWISIGMALHSVGQGSKAAFATWDEWSQKSSKYDAGQMRRKWASFKAQPGVGEPPNTEAANDALVAKPLRAFVQEKSVIDFLMDDVFRRGWLYLMTGNTGHGKTGVAVPLALSAAAGSTFAGHECEAVPVGYIAGENPDDVRSRFVVAMDRMRPSDETFARVHIIDQSFLLAERVCELCALIEKLQLGLIIVDTDQAVSLVGSADENGNNERMEHAKVLRMLTRCSSRPTVLDLCHPRARAQKDDLIPRGGSSFLNEVDGNLRLWRDGEVAELYSDPNKWRGQPVTMSFKSEMVLTSANIDRKGRLIPVPFFRAIDDAEAAVTAETQWREENRLAFVMNDFPSMTQAEWAEKCGWLGEDAKPRKDKVNRLLKNMSQARPALANKSRSGRWVLTKEGAAEAQKR